MDGYTKGKEGHLKRLRRIEGQVRGLQRGIEEDKCCIDVLTHVSDSTHALQSFSLGPLDAHLAGCAAGRGAEGPARGPRQSPRGARGHRPARHVLTTHLLPPRPCPTEAGKPQAAQPAGKATR
jgi:DNA-binding FrmR family transcriptional regulator